MTGMHMQAGVKHAGWCALANLSPSHLHIFTPSHTFTPHPPQEAFTYSSCTQLSFTHTHSHRCAPPLSAWARLCDWQCADQALHTRVGSSHTMESAHRSQLMLLQPPTASLPPHTSCLALHTGQVRSSSSSANMRSSTRVYPASTSR